MELITYLGVIDFFEEADFLYFFFFVFFHMFNKVTLYSPKDSKAILLLVTSIDPSNLFRFFPQRYGFDLEYSEDLLVSHHFLLCIIYERNNMPPRFDRYGIERHKIPI
jgi:hypothetical protein